MINARRFVTANEMHEGMCDQLMFGHEFGTDYDWTHGTEVGLHNVSIGVKSFDWSFDLKRLWMPKSRWTMMVRQYIDPTALDDWRVKVDDRLKGKGRGIAVLRPRYPHAIAFDDDHGDAIMTRTVQGRGAGRGVRRRWGSCMLSLSYRTNPTPVVSMHSRTTYFGYLAAMDITVAHAFAREASQITGIAVEDMGFVWTLELAQFHGFRSLAWALGDAGIREELDEARPRRLSIKLKEEPGFRKALDGYDRILRSDEAGKLYGDEAFSSFARVRRRFHTEVFGVKYGKQFEGGSLNRGGKGPFPPLPSVPASTLDFSCLTAPTRDYVEDDDDADE